MCKVSSLWEGGIGVDFQINEVHREGSAQEKLQRVWTVTLGV
jgi:hypothetical protein